MKIFKYNPTGMLFIVLQETYTHYMVLDFYHNTVEEFTKAVWDSPIMRSDITVIK